SIHFRKSSGMSVDDCFDEEPIPEDLETKPELELEPELESELGPELESELESESELEPRDKARNRALAKLAGVYCRDDSDSDTQSVFDIKMAFQNLLAPPRPASPSSFSSGLPPSGPAQTRPKEPSPALAPRPCSGYDLRTIAPEDITGSWILEERNCYYDGDVFNNHDDQDRQIATLKRQLEVAANSDNRTNNSSTNSSPYTNNQISWLNDSDTNTEYSTSASPTFSPIAAATNASHRYTPSGPSVYPYPDPYGVSPPLPDIEAVMEKPSLSTFESDSSSQTSATTAAGKKYAVKKSLRRKKAREGVEEGVGGGSEKKGWKNSIKKSAIAKFLMGGN
ncbi:hypothetical protein C7212DRAFT_153984, partial [Tuber magnatum]